MILHLHSTFKLAASLIVVCGSVITPAVAIDNVDVHWTEEDTTDNVQYQAAAGLRTSTIEESAIVVAPTSPPVSVTDVCEDTSWYYYPDVGNNGSCIRGKGARGIMFPFMEDCCLEAFGRTSPCYWLDACNSVIEAVADNIVEEASGLVAFNGGRNGSGKSGKSGSYYCYSDCDCYDWQFCNFFSGSSSSSGSSSGKYGKGEKGYCQSCGSKGGKSGGYNCPSSSRSGKSCKSQKSGKSNYFDDDYYYYDDYFSKRG